VIETSKIINRTIGESNSREGSSAGESEPSFNLIKVFSHLDDFVLPHSYRIPPGGKSRYTNTSVVNELGKLAGKKYIVTIKGWMDRESTWNVCARRISLPPVWRAL